MSGLFGLFKKQRQSFDFTITIHQIIIQFSKPVRVAVIFQHSKEYVGKKRTETNKYPYSPSVGMVDFNQPISIQHTIFKDKLGCYKPKILNLTVQAYLDNNVSKKIAALEIDISEFCVLPIKEQSFQLKDAADKNARILMSVAAVVTNEKQDSGTGDSGTGTENMSTDSKNKKPPVYKEKSKNEDMVKLNQLEQALVEAQRERDELKIKAKVKSEHWENEKSVFKDQLSELDQRLSDAQELYVKNKRKKIEYKKNFLSTKAKLENFEKKMNDFQDETSELEVLLEKLRNRKRGLKEQMKEILQHEQKLSQELIQVQFVNKELNEKLKEKVEVKGPDIDNVEFSRSRRNTDLICNP